MKRKYDSINIMKLYSLGSNVGWNEFLTKCTIEKDINSLKRVRYGIQMGMSEATNAKMNSEHLNVFYIRLNRSLEITARRILQKQYKNQKQTMENEFQRFIKESAY